MCSFLFSTKYILESDRLKDANFFNKLRGPDHTNILYLNGCTIIHNLLSMFDQFNYQPRISSDYCLLFNGEIYNTEVSKNGISDTQYLETMLSNPEVDVVKFLRSLDGEFSIVYVCWKTARLIVARDTFGTKPLFISKSNSSISISTLKPTLEDLASETEMAPEEFPCNTVKIFSLQDFSILDNETLTQFCLDQTIDTYSLFEEALIKSISKRTRIPIGVPLLFSGLSSGYDSGILHLLCSINNHDIRFYTIGSSENNKIIRNRRSFSADTNITHKFLPFKYLQKRKVANHMDQYLFKFNSEIKTATYDESWLDMRNDNGAKKFTLLCCEASKDKRKIFLSGVGPDEIFSDYGFNGQKYYPHSNFGGLFPSDLNTIFPWPSFYGSSLSTYIKKEEFIGGSFGFEVRYPFLCKNVVQQFLSLSQHLKNANYKAPLRHIMFKYNYPIEENKKRGF